MNLLQRQSKSSSLSQLILLFALGAGMGIITNTAVAADYRDLNHNGQMDAYENPALSIARRVDDLLQRMTREEKVALMLHGNLPGENAMRMGLGTAYDHELARQMIARGVNSMITRISTDPVRFATENNAIQAIAAQTRLGIPVTISTDPRNHFNVTVGAATLASGFSLWPEPLGFAAIGSDRLVQRFGELVAREYRAVGIHMALSPQADLYTEPRWPRGTATFGSDPQLVSRLAGAYVRGFQGKATGLAPTGVATVVKHWVGYGAQPHGFDGHNAYGKDAQLDEASFKLHVAAFAGALQAHSAGVMPTYIIPNGASWHGQALPKVGAGFNEPLISGLLRREHGFQGLVISDWGITADCPSNCSAPTAEHPQGFSIAMPWGVEHLTQAQRYALGANAGIDQFGGVDNPAPLLAAVESGQLSMARVEDSARRVLSLKYQLGLFDHPFVDIDAVRRIVGNPATQAQAEAAQRAAQVLLKNQSRLLPLSKGKKVWLSGLSAATAEAAGLHVVEQLEMAEVAIIRVATPFEMLHPYHFFGSRQHEGRLDFRADDPAVQTILTAAKQKPTIVAVDLDRPAVLTVFHQQVNALLGLFGASDAVVFDLLTGKAKPQGRLPFELPSSAAAVEAQHPARPDDSAEPLYRRGAGLAY